MKKRVAVLLALIMGLTYCPSGTVAMAAGNQEKNAETEVSKEKAAEAEGDAEKKEDSFLKGLLGNFFSEEEKEASDENSDKSRRAADEKSASQKTSGLKNLQIPQKLDVVIDPWEMDKKGQVYSEQYTISNTGDRPGILTLSNLACRPREQSGVIVRTDKEGLHDSGDKAIYMEMLFGNGEQIIFSQESSQYQKELKPGEELSIRFAGEVNENAFGKWENNDVAVSVVYSWEMEEVTDADAENQEEKIQRDSEGEVQEEEKQDDGNSEETEKTGLNPEAPGADAEAGESEAPQPGVGEENEKQPIDENETQEPSLDANEVQESPSDISEAQEVPSNVNESVGTEQTGIPNNVENGLLTDNSAACMQESQTSENNPTLSEQKKHEIKNINLLSQQVDVSIDSWKTDEKGQIVSPEYLLHNTENTAGIWTLSEIVCEPKGQSGVIIQKNKNDLHNGEGKAVYMELVLGNGEKIILSQEKSQYKVELKPGEELSVRFVGEMNGDLFETRENGEIAVKAVCTWELK